MEMLNKLEAYKSITVSSLEIREFITFCNKMGVYPCGGAILEDNRQVLYI